jgi:hypothetical protein
MLEAQLAAHTLGSPAPGVGRKRQASSLPQLCDAEDVQEQQQQQQLLDVLVGQLGSHGKLHSCCVVSACVQHSMQRMLSCVPLQAMCAGRQSN